VAFLLDRLTLAAIVDKAGRPLQAFQRLWQKNCELTEQQEATQDELLEEMLQVQSDIIDALEAAGIALDAANAAAASATAAARETARINSYPSPSDILSAADAGTTATITVDDHDRIYPVQGTVDVPDLAITGSDITGLSFATLYYVYYDDTTLADTTPTFQATTDAATAQVGAAAGRHFVGSITTPADGGIDTSGGGVGAPGGTLT
jgi:hypothetical protein